MEIIRTAKKLGNSAGVLLPKKLLGCEVKVTVVKRPVNIKRKAMKVLEPDLENILGIYILNKKPVEILAISNKIRKIISNQKLKITLVPLSLLKKDIKANDKLKKKIKKAEVILNKSLFYKIKKSM